MEEWRERERKREGEALLVHVYISYYTCIQAELSL